MNLRDLKIGEHGEILAVGGEGSPRQHFLDMGLVPGTEVTLMKYAPMGDPMELRIHDYELTLRLADAEKIEIRRMESEEAAEETAAAKTSVAKPAAVKVDAEERRKRAREALAADFLEHPGLGEGGRFHDKGMENPLPEGTILTFALAGNQNCGKTTLFNQLTGSNQHVGNFPGVTVDRKSGPIRDNRDTLVTDLPGIYSLSPYTSEEIVSRDFILKEKPAGIINIVDATNIERNLYLTMQLMELDVPMVLALNMMDEVRGNGGSIDINMMEKLLGIPVVPISAAKNEGVHELITHALHVAKYQERPLRQDFCDKSQNGGAVHRCLHGIMHVIEDHADTAGIPCRFAASKLAEGDPLVAEALKLDPNERELIDHMIIQMEDERGLDHAAAMADMRFAFIQKICDAAVVKPRESREHARSRRVDEILTGKYTAIPVFLLIMTLVFYLTFNVVGAFLQNLLALGVEAGVAALDALLTRLAIIPGLHSLVIDGICAGVGSVISFLPIIVVLFVFLSLLEDSGYMARVAFVMDKLLRKIGLSGRSIVPLLIGFGCTVPAVMASRTMPSERDRKMTIFLTPFMSCTAKLPVYGFFANAFFPGRAGLIMVGLYFFSILMGILVSLIAKRTAFKGEAVPFVMELPNYRMPGLKNVAMLLWDKAKDFLERAFTVILLASIVIWFLRTFDFSLKMVADSADSILAALSGFAAPLFRPFGCGDWRIVTSLVTGFLAKESVVSGLNVLFGGAAAVKAAIEPVSAAALLVFCLLYTPCVAAIAAIRRELGRRWAFFVILFQFALAWICAYVVYLAVGMIFA